MRKKLSRRTFGQSVVAGLSLAGVPTLLRGQGAAQRRVRQSALELPPNDPVFQKYAAAVKAMHDRNDARSWMAQARIHADHCTHDTPEFLPWHRHYVNQFEQICGELVGDPTFALPYWDWSFGAGKIPDAFFDIKELNVAFWNDAGVYDSPNWPRIDTIGRRDLSKGAGVQADPLSGGSFTSRTIHSILSESSFRRFVGRLESTPHNSGHVVVGGRTTTPKPGHMSSGLSPLDPLFWLHHCNVDRLWAQWQLAGNSTPKFNVEYKANFVDRSGNPIDVRADNAIDFSALGYTYEQFPEPRTFMRLMGSRPSDSGPLFQASDEAAESTEVIGGASKQVEVEVGIPASVKIPVSNLQASLNRTRVVRSTDLPSGATIREAGGPTPRMLMQFGREKNVPRQVLARLRGIQSSLTSTIVNVYLDCPYLSPQTPYTDAHYADSFAFFGPSHMPKDGHGHGQEREILVDLTNALRNIDIAAASDLTVQFLPVGDENRGSFQVASIDIVSS